jgi:hypothetical protein
VTRRRWWGDGAEELAGVPIPFAGRPCCRPSKPARPVPPGGNVRATPAPASGRPGGADAGRAPALRLAGRRRVSLMRALAQNDPRLDRNGHSGGPRARPHRLLRGRTRSDDRLPIGPSLASRAKSPPQLLDGNDRVLLPPEGGGPDRGIQLFGTAGVARGTSARRAETAYSRRFRAYARWHGALRAKDEARGGRFFRFRPRAAKLFDEPALGSGVFVVASVRRAQSAR